MPDTDRDALLDIAKEMGDNPNTWDIADTIIANRAAVLKALGKDTSLNCDECMADYGRGFEDGKASMKARAEATERSYENQRVAAEQIAVNLRDALARAEAAEAERDADKAEIAGLRLRAHKAEAKVARVEALRDDARQFDITLHPVPPSVDVPDDYERGVHDMEKKLTAALEGDDDE